jgi:hypothetical protein
MRKPALPIASIIVLTAAALSVPVAAQGEPVRVAEFVADCGLSHRLADDPIVLPNLAGASHFHDFFGNHSTNARSTQQSLEGQTGNCNPAADISSYWVPTMYRNNTAIAPTGITFYYLGEGVNNPAAIQPTPYGLKIVAGNAKATGDADSIARWSCLHAGHVNPSKNFVECPAGTMLETYLDFPQCWDGRTPSRVAARRATRFRCRNCGWSCGIRSTAARQGFGSRPAPGRPCTATSSTCGRAPRWNAASATASTWC